MIDIVASLLRITELEEDGQERRLPVINLEDVVREVTDAYRPIFEEHARTLSVFNSVAADVRGDAQLLSQLLSNLLENILTHTPEGTHAFVAVKPAQPGWLLSVADDGPGIPVQDTERIFARFHRGHKSRSTKGHGLGLSLVKAIALYHHADCKARNVMPGLDITARFAAVD